MEVRARGNGDAKARRCHLIAQPPGKLLRRTKQQFRPRNVEYQRASSSIAGFFDPRRKLCRGLQQNGVRGSLDLE
jgi:hypothetical protein